MVADQKKKTVDSTKETFQNSWKQNSKCQKTVAVIKEFNILRHYETNHAQCKKKKKKHLEDERAQKLKQLEAILKAEETF